MEKFFKHLKALLLFIVQEYEAQDCSAAAKALTYTSLFAVVPLMTVTYVMLAAIPMFKDVVGDLEKLIFQHFVPSTGSEVLTYLSSFSEQAKDLTGVGIVMLALTAYMMLKNIEEAFNTIWHVKNPRRGLRSFLLYWAILSLGPLLLGGALAMRTFVLSLDLISDSNQILGSFAKLFILLPWFFTAAAFALMYLAVPNCAVPFRSAVIGGVVTSTLFTLTRSLFTWSMSASSYQLIYGAFATVPLFLIWIYLSWMILLLGAQLVKGLSSYAFDQSGVLVSDHWIELLTLEMFWQKQQSGGVLDGPEALRKFHDMGIKNADVSKWHKIKDKFLRCKIIIGAIDGGYVLNRDLDELTVWDVIGNEVDELMKGVKHSKVIANKQWCEQLSSAVLKSGTAMKQGLSFSTASLFRGTLVWDANAEIEQGVSP